MSTPDESVPGAYPQTGGIIAVIGMACRFPGASHADEFWQLLHDGLDGITEVPSSRWRASDFRAQDPPPPGQTNTHWGGFLEDVDQFDAALFGVSPREAAAMDPQQRLMLELAWEAVEDAGLPAEHLRGTPAAVYIGAMASDYETVTLRDGPEAIGPYTFTGLQRTLIANRISRCFGVTGSSMTIDSGQSSSLAAVHLACQSLRSGEAELAIAGGVHLHLAPESYLQASQFGALSADGRCHVFDARANGFVPGEGGAIMVLKPLISATADGDEIICLILGSAVNNSGSAEAVGVPDPQAQRAAIEAALRTSGVEPDDIQYVELHGTGTPRGDVAEATALGAVFRSQHRRSEPLRVGSVKANIGHLGGAAGIAGLVKTALSIAHAELPPTPGYQAPNPMIPMRDLGIEMQRTLETWPRPGRPRLAGVSSFGVGGTNCHVILGSPPARADTAARAAAPVDPMPWVLSAHTNNVLRSRAGRLIDHLVEHPDVDPADIGYALATTRSTMAHRAVLITSQHTDVLVALSSLVRGEPSAVMITGTAYRTATAVFVFPGQGAQWRRMATRLLAESEVFRASIAACEYEISRYTDWNLGDVLRAANGAPGLDRVDVVQPALFAVMVSLAALWKAHGVEPQAVVGHSQGEIAAAHVAGALSLGDAARVVALRSKIISRLAGSGGMLAVGLAADKVERYLGRAGPSLSLAAVNGPGSCVVGGSRESLDALRTDLARSGVRTSTISVDYASHSPQVEKVREEILRELAGIQLMPTRVPFCSSVTGSLLAGNALDAGYWYRNLREPVRFDRAARYLLDAGHNVFIEVSTHPVLSAGMSEVIDDIAGADGASGDATAVAVSTLCRDDGGYDRFLRSLAEAYVNGVPVLWPAAFGSRPARRVKLPRYPFQRQSYWVDHARKRMPHVLPNIPADCDRPRADDTADDTADDPSVATATLPALRDLICGHTAALLGYASATDVDPGMAFRDLGLDSPRSVQLCQRLSTATGRHVPATAVFEAPNPEAMARLLSRRARSDDPVPPSPAPRGHAAVDPIVIVSAACRFPNGIDTPEGLWQFVVDGRETAIGFPTDRGWDVARLIHPDPAHPATTYAQGGGFLEGAGLFDAGFFGTSPREALAMDPQQRILLEICWEAVERAGIDPRTIRATNTGVFVGAMPSDYGPRMHAAPPDLEGHLLRGTTPSVISGRIAYVFDFEGPAVTVDTACSSSLVALHLAVKALTHGECSMALAGGVTVMATPGLFLDFGRQRGLSADGRCRSFSAEASGVGWSEGAGVVLLERLSDARRLGHPALAVVAGTATNQDGASNGLMAPSGPAQERVIRAALKDAALSAGQVGAVEAHGTGTKLGDPIEAAAVQNVYGYDRHPGAPLWLGSLKSNIGHAQAAAGIGGVVKMVMALRHGVLPRSMYSDSPSADIDWTAGTVRLLQENQPWPPQATPRRVGISSFGISGTNAHVILEEAPGDTSAPQSLPGDAARTVPMAWPFSAKGPEALRSQARQLLAHLERVPDAELPATGQALAATRSVFANRAVVLGMDRPALARGLAAVAEGRSGRDAVTGVAGRGKLAFLFSGQGSQVPGMGRELSATFPTFAHALDAICAEMDPHLTGPLREVMFAADDDAGSALVHRTEWTQPCLFAWEVALYRLLESWGVVPDVLLGHSAGELAAAHVAGVLSLSDACTLVAARGRIIGQLTETGAMVAVRADEDEAATWLADHGDALALAAVNSPADVVISGRASAIHALIDRLRADGRKCRLLKVSQAFHSPLMDPVLPEFERVARTLTYGMPAIPVVTSVTGRVAAGAEIRAPDYWVRHAREPVQFRRGMESLASGGARYFLEIGASSTLASLGRRCLADDKMTLVPSVQVPFPEPYSLLRAVATLQVRGGPIEWKAVDPAGPGPRTALPTYPFQREAFWIPVSVPDHSAAEIAGAPRTLFDAAIELPETGGLVLATRLSAESQPWLAGHTIDEVILLPGTMLADWAVQAAERLGYRRIRELTELTPLVFTETGGMDIRITIGARDQDGSRPITVHARAADSDTDTAWTRHAIGRVDHDDVQPGAPPESWPPPGAELVQAGCESQGSDGCGIRRSANGQALGQAWRSGDTFFVEAAISAGGGLPPVELFHLHPALLETAFSVVSSHGLSCGTRPARACAWRNVCFYRTGTTAVRIQAEVRRDGTRRDGTETVGLTAWDLDGRPVASAEVSLRPAPAIWGAHEPGLYVLAWTPLPTSARAGTGDRGPSIRAAAGREPTGAANPSPASDLLVASVPAEDADLADAIRLTTTRVLRAIQGRLAGPASPDAHLTVVTSRAVAVAEGEEITDLAGSAAWGLVRAAQREYPNRMTIIDVEDMAQPVASLRAALASGEPQIALRGGKVYRPRLVLAPTAAGSAPQAQWDPAGTVLITGGTGALGQRLARHLAHRHGVRHLLLLSRSGSRAPGAESLVRDLSSSGAQTVIVSGDVSNSADLARVLGDIPADHPLVAIFHTAGVLDDCALLRLTPERIERVLAAKAIGALHLHRLTQEMAPTAFVLYSSAIGLLGGAGQANYAAANGFLDGLAQQRRARGLPAQSLAWGLWDLDEGMAAGLSPEYVRRMGQLGLVALNERQALGLLEAALSDNRPLVMPALLAGAADVPSDGGCRASVTCDPVSDVLPAEADGSDRLGHSAQAASLREQTLQADSSRQYHLLLAFVRAQVADVLGFRSGDAIDPQQEIWELGLESLAALQLATRLTTSLGLDLPTTLAFDYPTAHALAVGLREELRKSADCPEPVDGPRAGRS